MIAADVSPFPRRRVAAALFVVAAVAASVRWLDLDLASLVSARTLDAVGETAARLVPPRTDSETLAKAALGAVETLSMSIVGTLLGAVIGLALMPFACQTLFARGPLVDEDGRSPVARAAAWTLHQAGRLAANALRTVPYFVWAVLFWFMVGPGTFPGALAIAVHTGGVIARNYAQALDQLDPRPLAALRASGARRSHVLLFGMLPAARTALASLTLYRWEVNIRESTVLGLVGAGGLGFHLSYGIGTFDWKSVGTYLAATMLLVLLVDALSSFVRRRLL